jgi:lipopolysaccharide export system protein LptA
VLLLASGFVLFAFAYGVYSHFLGGIDGLPQLPGDYEPVAGVDPPPLPVRQESGSRRKLKIAFGDDCPEVKYKFTLELAARGIVLAAEDARIVDGKVVLTPFSMAIFGKDKGDGGLPEINTLRSKEAYLTFDKPITNIATVDGSRKIVAGELRGDIRVVNNRRTPQPDDDIWLDTQGPIYYEESRHLIWTDKEVHLRDLQSKPEPLDILGTELALYLTSETKPAEPAQHGQKKKQETVTGVERIQLGSNVMMNLWVDAHSGFLGTEKAAGAPKDAKDGKDIKDKKTAKPAKGANPESGQAERVKVVIRTQGPFVYDLRTDRATFAKSARPALADDLVNVDRLNDLEGTSDHLECDHLDIHFSRKNAATAASQDNRPEGLDIDTARATGQEVKLKSDSEGLEAYGNDFFYDRIKHLSTLKGEPKMYAFKEGNEIRAHELQLLDVKGAQQATALGDGTIQLLDKKTGKRSLEARWNDKLIYAKDGVYDVLTLHGDAAFVDPDQNQELRADLLKVWLEPAAPSAAATQDPNDPHGRKPHHLDAMGRVRGTGAELKIHDTERLVVWFRDVPPSAVQLPPALPAAGEKLPAAGPTGTKSGDKAQQKQQQQQQQPTGGGILPDLTGSVRGTQPGQPAAKKQPIDLSARLIDVHVLRTGPRNDLDKLYCEGTVRVHQDPSGPDDKGVDIQGDTLELTHHADGNVLAVTGKFAIVQLNKISILGPEVNIDQTMNEVWVNGLGLMRMPSNSNLDGSKANQTSDLTVNWKDRMLFNGQNANFWGGIRAEQDTGRLLCHELQVTLDRKISLREGDKGKQPAKVQRLVCDREVWMEDVKRQAAKLLSVQTLECREMSMDNDPETGESDVAAEGPGRVRLFQQGSEQNNLVNGPQPGGNQPGGTGKPQAPAKPARPAAPVPAATAKGKAAPTAANAKGQAAQTEEYHLTEVAYQGRMRAQNQKGLATFYDQVRVIDVPTNNPDLKVNDVHLPAGSMFLSCEKLEVLRHKQTNGDFTREMRAYKKVFIEAQEFSGHADIVKYDESKQIIILEGTDGHLAVLNKEKKVGVGRDEFKARKMYYNRITGDVRGDEVYGIQFNN